MFSQFIRSHLLIDDAARNHGLGVTEMICLLRVDSFGALGGITY